MNEPTPAETIARLERERARCAKLEARVEALEAERDNWKETVLAEIEENKKLFDLLGLTTADSFGHKTSTQAVTDAVRVLKEQVQRLEADKRRLDWLEENKITNALCGRFSMRFGFIVTDSLRAAIDLDMKDA